MTYRPRSPAPVLGPDAAPESGAASIALELRPFSEVGDAVVAGPEPAGTLAMLGSIGRVSVAVPGNVGPVLRSTGAVAMPLCAEATVAVGPKAAIVMTTRKGFMAPA